MGSELQLGGPTVTMFGERDALDQAISEELGRRGCGTHAVTVATGWLSSTRHAVIRVDTPAGESALDGLLDNDAPPTTVVAVCPTLPDDLATRRLHDLCRRCGEHHDVSLIWHEPFGTGPGGAASAPGADDLAVAIAEAVGVSAETSTPSFAARVFTAQRHRGHP